MSNAEPRPQPAGEPDGTPAEQVAASAGRPSLADQLAAMTADRDAQRDNWLRAQAELENYRRRMQKEAEQARMYQAQPLAGDLLPVLDNLRRAVVAAESTHNVEELTKGVQMVIGQLESVLGRHAIKPIEAIGQPFDPHRHEAIQQQPSAEHPPMTVMHEAERGYTLHDRILRPSRVVVSRPPEEGEG